MSNSNAAICPDCGSPFLTYSQLEGGEAICKACGWKGMKSQLVFVPFNSPFVDPDEAVRLFVQDLKSLMAKEMGVEILRILIKWGFVPDQPEIDKVKATKYVANMGRAIAFAALQTRAQLEAEDKAFNGGVPVGKKELLS